MKRRLYGRTQDAPLAETAPADVTAEAEADVEASLAADINDDAPAPAATQAPLYRRAAYRAVYAVSFGAVFSSLLLKRILVPKDTVIEAALHDGAVAARQAFAEKARVVEEVAQATEDLLAGTDTAVATPA